MADYTQPDVVNKRVRFFDGQFLQDQDFIDEQKYHLDRERRQSQLLSVTGILSGLTVVKGGAYHVTVTKGVAVDALGRQLVLAAETDLRLPDKFAAKKDIELHLVYQEIPTDLAQTGGEGARRWDESPKIVALAPDGAVAVAPDGVSSTWDGPTVLLAKLAVAANGDVTVDTAAARKAGLSVPGSLGIGTSSPGSDVEIGNFDARNRYLTLKVGGGNQYRSGVKLWAWQENYGYSVEYDERWATGNGLHVRTHDRNADGMTRLFVGWNGNVGVGTTGPPWKLSVSSSKEHLALYREPTETAGGTHVFLELAQIDKAPAGVPEVFPCIRFHHHNRFWHRIEAQGGGFHFKTGDPARNDYSDIRARNIYATGKLEVTGEGGVNVDLLVNGRLRSNNNDGGLWVAEDRFVGGHSTDRIGFFNGKAWRLSVLPNGNVGIGTTGPLWKLSVSSSTEHLALYRESTETAGGAHVFLELGQIDSSPAKVPEVFPSIRFHHHNRFWHRIEAQGGGFHFKTGDPARNDYSDIRARNIYATGKLEVTGEGGVNVDLLVNGRLRSNNNDGGLWVAEDRFVGGHSTDRIGFFNGKAWRLSVLPNGNVGIGTTGPPWKLSVSSSTEHLALYRESTETAGGAHVFLELGQIDSSPAKVPEVFPSIRFHHHNRFWHRIEGQGSGFHFKTGNPTSNDYSEIRAGALRIGGTTIGEAELSILKKLAAGTLEFYLLNVPHNEYAYAASDGFKYDSGRRRIFTWAEVKGQRVTQGVWQIQPV